MAAITLDKPTVQLDVGTLPSTHSLPVKASTNIPAGALVVTDATGYAVNGQTALNLIAWGVAEARADNSSGASGAISVETRPGVWKFENSSAADLIGQTEWGKTVYIVDNQTVAKTDGGGTRSAAGKVISVDSDGRVFVAVGLWV